MNNERLIKLNNSEIFRMKVCLSARKEDIKATKIEDNTDIEAVKVVSDFLNDEVNKEIEVIDGIYEKLSSNKSICADLEELSKADLILKIKELENKNYELKEENEDLKYDLNAVKELDNMTTIEVASYFTSYENIQRRYDANDVPYQMQSVEDLAKVFGLRFESIQGFYDLSQEDKEIFKNGIVKFLNGFGLGNRVPYLPTKVWKENNEFRFLTLEGKERQQFMNSKGEVY